jgi:predicted RNA-binding protein YlxR (DUF448 family)
VASGESSKTDQSDMRHKHVPQRTCSACREVKPKRELIRVVRTPEGTVVVDEMGKASGRGAYLCRARACWEKGIGQSHQKGSGPLAHALKVTLSDKDRAALLAYAEQLPGTASEDATD